MSAEWVEVPCPYCDGMNRATRRHCAFCNATGKIVKSLPVAPCPSEAPCPSCGGSAMVALCGRTDTTADGPCVLRGGHFGPCYGEDDVASDWTPAASCRDCCVCLCGSTDDGTECPYCHVTMRPGVKTTKDIATWKVVFG